MRNIHFPSESSVRSITLLIQIVIQDFRGFIVVSFLVVFTYVNLDSLLIYLQFFRRMIFKE